MEVTQDDCTHDPIEDAYGGIQSILTDLDCGKVLADSGLDVWWLVVAAVALIAVGLLLRRVRHD